MLVLGANSSLTAAVVVLTGLVGANFVQAMLDKLRFDDPIARGIATASRYVPSPQRRQLHFVELCIVWNKCNKVLFKQSEEEIVIL